MSADFQIRTMTRPEVDFAVDLAAAEGWNPGLHDADAFFAADPEGFLVGQLDGEPIGCISAVAYPGGFGFIGFYIVLPEYRGQGYGIQLWRRAMGRFAGSNVGLDGVYEQQDNYRKSGFVLACSNVRYEHAAPVPEADAGHVRELRDGDLEAVMAYDQRCFPVERRAFVEAWLQMRESLSLGCFGEGGLEGYGTIRRCRQGWKVGPLFAEDADSALAIYSRLAAFTEPAGPIYLDVPEVNGPGTAMAEALGMKPVFGTARMYTGDFPPIDHERIFGVTTFELG